MAWPAVPTRRIQADRIYTVSDSFTKVWGNHTVKLGAEFQNSGENDNDQINVSTVPGGANNQKRQLHI